MALAVIERHRETSAGTRRNWHFSSAARRLQRACKCQL